MIVAQNDGVTHERIGNIERVEKQAGRVFCIGQAHNCSIDLASVSSVVIDRTARMKDRVLPKLEFQNATEETLFTVVSLDNGDKFDTGFASFAGVPVVRRTSDPRRHRRFPATILPFNLYAPRSKRALKSKFRCGGRDWISAGAEWFPPSIPPWGSSI